jgi:hypothetical protein
MLNRKQLPPFGVLDSPRFDIEEIVSYCKEQGFLDVSNYTDVKASANSDIKQILEANHYAKNNFFKEEDAAPLEGEKYVQLYLTGMDPAKRSKEFKLEPDNAKIRFRRLRPDDPHYLPEADEHNYGVRNERVAGPLEKLLDSFKAPLARVRFAAMAPGFEIKPHTDYDPTYITRFHLPLLTNKECLLYAEQNGVTVEKHLPVDGKVYFLNTGVKHWAVNRGDTWRIHILIDVKNQDDLENMKIF